MWRVLLLMSLLVFRVYSHEECDCCTEVPIDDEMSELMEVGDELEFLEDENIEENLDY